MCDATHRYDTIKKKILLGILLCECLNYCNLRTFLPKQMISSCDMFQHSFMSSSCEGEKFD